MPDIDKLYYIMDYSGNYFRINDRDDLVIAKNVEEAAVFSFIEANERINGGHKNKFYFMTPVEEKLPSLDYDITQIDWKEYVNYMATECEDNVYELKKILYPPEVINEVEEAAGVEDNATEGKPVSMAV